MPDRAQTLEDLVSFISSLDYDDLPETAVRTAERCFVDTVGVIYPGAAKSAGRRAAGMAERLDVDGPARILGADIRASPLDAAFVNGTAAHGLDFDDSQGAIPGHPSGVIVPTVLSASYLVDGTGEDAITAYVAGFEAEYYVGRAIYPHHYDHGWHANGTLGTFGAVAAAARFLDLGTDRVRHAVNIASSMPAGIRSNFGTDTKPMHSGGAARSGLTAALLADAGFTGGENALAGEHGFFDVYAGTDPPSLDALPVLGDGWAIEDIGVDVKKYACTHPTHGCIEAARRLVDEHDLNPSDIEHVHCRVSGICDEACRWDDPGTGLEAKFSLPYAVACGIALDRLTIETFGDDAIDDPTVQSVRERISYERDTGMPYRSFGGSVEITTSVGETVRRTLEYPPGAHEEPLTEDELREKFEMCAGYADLDDPAAVYRALDALRSVSEMRDLAERV